MATSPAVQIPANKNLRAKFNQENIPSEWTESWKLFKEAIQMLFGQVKYLDELAKITAFLSDTSVCRTALQKVDEELCKIYVSQQAGIAKGVPRKKLSECILQLAARGGFTQMQGVVLTGDAGTAFGLITGSKIMFKDGLSSIHGEFTHSLQWLAVIECAGMLGIPVGNVADIYAYCGTTSMIKNFYLTGEKPGGKGEDKNRFKKSGLFDFVCDAFLFNEGDQDQTFLLHNLFSKSARSPAFISMLIKDGNLPFLHDYYYCWEGLSGKYTQDKRNNIQAYREQKAHDKEGQGALQRIGADKAYAPPGFLDLPDPYNRGKVIGQRFDPNYLRKK